MCLCDGVAATLAAVVTLKAIVPTAHSDNIDTNWLSDLKGQEIVSTWVTIIA